MMKEAKRRGKSSPPYTPPRGSFVAPRGNGRGKHDEGTGLEGATAPAAGLRSSEVATAPTRHCWLCGKRAAIKAHDNYQGAGKNCTGCAVAVGKIKAARTKLEMREGLYAAAVEYRRMFVALNGIDAIEQLGAAPYPPIPS